MNRAAFEKPLQTCGDCFEKPQRIRFLFYYVTEFVSQCINRFQEKERLFERWQAEHFPLKRQRGCVWQISISLISRGHYEIPSFEQTILLPPSRSRHD